MAKYTPEIVAKAVALVKAGKTVTEVSKELGPNPKAISRYCAKAGVVIPKAKKAEKKTEAPKAAAPVHKK